MPRRQRITEAGYFHIINRGVERRIVFVDDSCYSKFYLLLEQAVSIYDFNIHAFCLMPNHYHILLETKYDNLPDIVRFLNLAYTKWFNTTHERIGHLWQGRYKSYFIYEDSHFWTVAKYIERNPIAANIVNDISKYPHQSFYLRLYTNYAFSNIISNSKILDMSLADYREFISTELSGELRKKVYSISRKNKDSDGKIYLKKSISSFFESNDGDRNHKIKSCYLYGFTKSAIADYLGISRVTIAKILNL